jgi:hypothetical protein
LPDEKSRLVIKEKEKRAVTEKKPLGKPEP